MSIAIIGCGAAGTLVFLELIKQGKSPQEVIIIDPYFDGGALARRWGNIYSNTRWQQITEAMMDYPSAKTPIDELSQKYQPDSRVLLSDLGWLLLESIRPFLPTTNIFLEVCQELQQAEEGWKLRTPSGIHLVSKVYLCQGGQEKLLDLGKPAIPLEIALDSTRLKKLVRPNQSVAVFGLAHSGTLACKHLLDIGAKVYGIYNKDQPFQFDRDGVYDGIKQESAEVADMLLQAPPKTFEFLRYQDIPKLLKSLGKVHWIVSAIGFEGSPIQIHDKNGSQISWSQYNPDTAEILPSLYGFGLAYPGVTNIQDKIYKDVSIPLFVAQIRRCLPSILSKS